MIVKTSVVFGIEKASLCKNEISRAKLKNTQNIFADENAQ